MITLPGYFIKEELYYGEKSIVYRADKGNKPVIIKVLQNAYPSLAELNAFKHEFEILTFLDQPGLVKAIGTEKYQNSFAIIFEDMGGIALSLFLKNRKFFSLSQILSISIKIARAIKEIHRGNVVHRDLKPANIVFNEVTGELNIIDFGSASFLSRQTSFIPINTSLEGTLNYISPEQTGRMNRTIDYRTDFYSLGVTIYQLLTGSLPFTYFDPMELVHAHIAKIPVAPQARNETPKPISDIVMKLLEKNPEDRYQNVDGIIYDLEWCLTNLETHRNSSLQIGTHDFSPIFQIPEKLYGRNKDVTQIMKSFSRVMEGTKELVFVSGQSGIGKSILINEVNKPIVEYKGYFISGKYELLKRASPYYAIVYALQGLIKQILSESQGSISYWKETILSAISPNGKILIDVIPELELLIGHQKPVPEVGPEESQNRFNSVSQDFIKVLCSSEHPLVIFLDDLQWADAPSLKLIQNILNDPDIKYLMLILSFRDNEVYPDHILSILLESLKREGFQYKEIYLKPLTLFDVHLLVTETLSCDKESCRSLAEILHAKTTGNPFFVNALFRNLYDKNLIFFSNDKWNWNLQRIREVEISENVIDLMVEKIQRLPVNFIDILKFSACIANEFKIEIFAQISGKDFRKLNLEVQVLSNEGFFIMTNSTARFVHDKVQEAVYSLMSREEKIKTHYKIGKWWLDNAPEKLLEENIFHVIGQLNLGKDLIDSQEERLLFVSLNWRAGKKAKASTAYESALNFLQNAVSYLPENKWESHYEFSFEIYKDFVECEYLVGNFNEADKLYEYILENTKSIFEKTPIIHIQLRQKATENKGDEAFQIGFAVLRELGLILPDHTDPIAVQRAFTEQLGEYELLLDERKIPELFDLPEMSDPKMREAISLITNLGDIAIAMKPEMLGLMSILGVNLSLKYGNTIVSPISYVMWGVISNLAFHDYLSGYALGQLSLKLNREKFPSDLIFAKLYAFYGWNINHFKHHTKEDMEIAIKGYGIAMANNDLVYSMYFIVMLLKVSFNIGLSLDEVIEYGRKVQLFVDRYKTIFATLIGNSTMMTALALQGKTDNPLSLNCAGYNEEEYLKEFSNYGQSTVYFYLRKFQLCYIFGEYGKCSELLPVVEKYFSYMPAHISYTEFYFYKVLLLISIPPSSNEEEQKQRDKEIAEARELFKLWSISCEDNFLHQFLLIEAEKAKIEGRDLEAMQLYEKSIASARKYEYVNNAALANELAAKYYLSKGLDKVAALYLTDAHYLYQVWGATAKVKQLEKKFSQLLKHSPRPVDLNLDVSAHAESITTIGATSSGNFLDLHTVVKASQTISGEIQLEKLLEKMMKIILENAGAERGFFLLKEKDQWFIKAEGNSNTDTIEVLEGRPLNGSADLCIGIVNYVSHTKNNILLNDAARKGVFVSDEYIKRKQSKSILCYPVMNHGSLLGLVYLENNLSPNAFTSARIEILKILSSQIAMSLENSLLYTNLEAKVVERTKDLEKTLENLKLTQKELIQSEKMAALGQLIAGIAHEINTPIGAISSSIQSVQGFLDKDFLQVLDFFIRASPDERNFMVTILNLQAQNKKFFSSKEKRQIKIKLEKILEEHKIEDAVGVADNLTDIGIHEGIEEFIPILKTSGITLLDKIYKLSILRKGLSNIQLATEKTSKIVYALKSYAHKEASGSKVKARIDTGMDTVLTLYQNVLNRGVELIKEYDAEIPEIDCYPDELNQVWINLIQNAIHAMESKGKLLIRIKQENSNLKIEITDNGKGIPVEVQDKIFQPFFTTKPSGEGSGLGLGIIKKILEKHEGTISFESKPGRTTFTILLPIKRII